jgi:hypothetical protein
MIYVEIALEIKKEITLKFDSKKDCIIQQILVLRFSSNQELYRYKILYLFLELQKLIPVISFQISLYI